MCHITSIPNLDEIHPGEGCFLWLKVIVLNRCKEEKEKCEENRTDFKNTYLTNYISNFLHVWYVKLRI